MPEHFLRCGRQSEKGAKDGGTIGMGAVVPFGMELDTEDRATLVRWVGPDAG